MSDQTWGEVLHGIRIAMQLHARGDRIVFLAPPSLEVLFANLPFKYGRFENTSQLARAVLAVAREQRCSSVILVDLALVYLLLEQTGADATFLPALRERGLHVIALDIWDLERAPPAWDFGATSWPLSRHSHAVTDRLVPVPIAHPSGAMAFDALPDVSRDPDVRREQRSRLGVGDDERIIFFPTARWQQTTATLSYNLRLASTFPVLIAEMLRRLDPRVRVLQVGGARMPELEASLGARYRWRSHVPEQEFLGMLSGADLLLSFNCAATTIGSALALDVPVLVGVNSARGDTVDEIAGRVTHPLAPEVVAWLDVVTPLFPFRMWPIGMYELMSRLLADNPYTAMLNTVEVLDLDAMVATASSLLFDDASRELASEAARRYVAQVRGLPKAIELVDRYLGSSPRSGV